MQSRPPRIGIGGPVGSGKTMLCLKLCQKLRDRYSIPHATLQVEIDENCALAAEHAV